MKESLPESEIIERLEAGLKRMPKVRREIFLAIRLDDLSYGEIAERTGLTAKQVERHFARSMVTLLEAFEGRPPVPWWRRALCRITERRRP